MAKSNKKRMSTPGGKVLAVNRKARFNYHILETFEAGMVLRGHEIKAIRNGGINLAESYIRPYQGALYLCNAYVSPYSHTSQHAPDPLRQRKLLLHKREIDKLRGRVDQKGLTIVPLDVHLRNGVAKLQIALAKGKAAPDKRQSIKERDQRREMARVSKYT